MAESRDRLTARKVRVEDVINGKYTQREGFSPNYLVTPYGLNVSRARILGTVVDSFRNEDDSYGNFVIDDGSETIRAKFFQDLEMMEGIQEGDIVEVMGKVKKYEGEVYITPELIVERSPNYELLRALEIREVRDRWRELVDRVKDMKGDGKEKEDIEQEMKGEGLKEDEINGILEFLEAGEEFERPSTPETAEEGGEEGGDAGDVRNLVLRSIDSMDEGEGAEYSEIREEAGLEEDELEDVINDLLSDGTCYEPRPGRIKRL